MTHGDTLTFHGVPARGGRVEQNIHEVIVEQVDFVDVEKAAVGFGE